MRNLKLFTSLLIIISPINAQIIEDTIEVGAGWNMIGALYNGRAIDIVRTWPAGIIVSQFYSYNPGYGYVPNDTLKKGRGYWIKMSEGGVLIFESGVEWACGNPIEYDGKTYNTILIDTQCWLRENLNVGVRINNNQNASDNGTIEKYCYSDISYNCDIYGALYQWEEAIQYTTTPGAKGICPPGWHIPTLAEFVTLSNAVGGDGNALKETGQGIPPGEGTNTSGFSALLAGGRDYMGLYYYLSYYAYFWSSTELNSISAYFMYLTYDNSDIFLNYYTNKLYGFSIRCLKD